MWKRRKERAEKEGVEADEVEIKCEEDEVDLKSSALRDTVGRAAPRQHRRDREEPQRLRSASPRRRLPRTDDR